MHIMLTMRPINEDGSWGSKQKKEYIFDKNGENIYDPKKRQYKCRSIPSTDWNDRGKADEWRKDWEDAANAKLERLGFEFRIDRRTYDEQGIEKIPTVHMGASASQMERKGIRTEHGNINREISVTNSQFRQLRARINHLKGWLKTETAASTASPCLADIISEMLNHGEGVSRYHKITDLKAAANALRFLEENHISDMSGLIGKVGGMNTHFNDVRDSLKKIERRIDRKSVV